VTVNTSGIHIRTKLKKKEIKVIVT